MASFECQVCFETCNRQLALHRLTTLNGDVLRDGDCGHPVCQSCMAAYVTARVQDQLVFGIRCPIEGCKNELFEQDVHKLVDASALKVEVSDQMAKLRKQDYTHRLSQFFDNLGSIKASIGSLDEMRLCPRCCVIIQKKSGCNSFGCICGHRFRFDGAVSIQQINDIVSKCLGELTERQHMSREDAAKQIMLACATKGIRRYNRVLNFAHQREIPIALAELHEQAVLAQPDALQILGDARRSRKIARLRKLLHEDLKIPLDEAGVIVQRAKAGEVAAQQMIRLARQRR